MPRGAANVQLTRARGCSAEGQPVGGAEPAVDCWDASNGKTHLCPKVLCPRASCAPKPEGGPRGHVNGARR
eukprot:3139963-Alexandrium_andersonii.AAC.1